MQENLVTSDDFILHSILPLLLAKDTRALKLCVDEDRIQQG